MYIILTVQASLELGSFYLTKYFEAGPATTKLHQRYEQFYDVKTMRQILKLTYEKTH